MTLAAAAAAAAALLRLQQLCVYLYSGPPSPSSPTFSILPTKLPCAPHPSLPPFPRHSPGLVALCKLPLLCKVGLALAFPCASPAPQDGAVEVTAVVVAAAAAAAVVVVVEDNILLPERGLRLERCESELRSGRWRQRERERRGAPAPSELRRLDLDSRGSRSRTRPEGAPLLQSWLRPPGGRSGSAAERHGLPSLLLGGARLPRCPSNLEASFP